MLERTFWDRCRRQPIDAWYRIGYFENGKFNYICNFENRFNWNSGNSYGHLYIETPITHLSTFVCCNGGGYNKEYANLEDSIFMFVKKLANFSVTYNYEPQGSIRADFENLLTYLQKEYPEYKLFMECLI